jgi:predicted AlkP superfamily phosphohydrolase/phosphomutase
MQVADWQVHGRDHEDTCSWPPDFAPALLAEFGDDMTDRPGQEWLCRMDLLSEHEYQFFVERLLDGIERKTKASTALLAQGNWDLFLVVFKEAHCVAHQCWHLLDESHAAHSAKLAQALRNPIKRVYQALDAAIGQLLASADSTTRTIVFSDLGMGPNYTGEHLLEQVLLRLERSHSSRPQRAVRACG